MELQNYIKCWENVYKFLINFVENEEDIDFEIKFEILNKDFNFFEESGNHEDLKSLLHLILKIANNHHRTPQFNDKIEKILSYFFTKIKQTLSNYEIFQLFKNNKKILLFLFQNKIITVNKEISDFILVKFSYRHFFYPEIKNEINETERKITEEELLALDSTILNNFDEKRIIGENDSYLCQLIRQDSIEEFVSFVNKTNLSLSTVIEQSIFETNLFLIGKNPTLIEYAAFFGSIQIFQFLKLNGVELNPSLWIYTIHSNNGELIHILEESEIHPPNNSFIKVYIESIKCHHNEIVEYIENNCLIKKSDKNDCSEKVAKSIFHYYNYMYFPIDLEKNHSFYYLHRYNYQKILNLYMNMIKEKIEKENYFNTVLFHFILI